MTAYNALFWLWLAWALSWVLAARWASLPIRVEAGAKALAYRALLGIGYALILVTVRARWAWRLWVPTSTEAWCLDGLAFIGFAFCWWARVYLGRLWSSAVTIKSGHKIIDSGPYAIVRHPIYSGLLLAIAASVAMNGTVVAIIGGLLMLIGFVIKAKLEEEVLGKELGRDEYEAYAKQVPMLLPFMHLG